jgi:heme/copper-type cytochrome/quinol oxidase subunit 2
MEQRIAVLVSAIVGTLVLALFAVVARSARATGNAEAIAASAARLRRTTFWGLVVLFVPTLAYSLTKTPYRTDSRPAAVVVEASGHQWAVGRVPRPRCRRANWWRFVSRAPT